MKQGKAQHYGAAPLPGAPTDAAARSYMSLPSEVGEVDGAVVLAFGRVFIYSVSPDLAPGVVIQEGNDRPWAKLQPKKSWEMEENHIGSMVSWQPRIPQNDFQPYLSFHLIDGNPETFWCSRGQGRSVQPEWVRIDLAREETLREIVIVPWKDGQGMPNRLEVRLSCDALHWTTAFEDKPVVPEGGKPVRIPLARPTPAKQIQVIATDLTSQQTDGWCPQEYHFLLSGIEAITEQGDNAALIKRGAGVTVSSTNYGHGDPWDVYDFMWPIQYDLGAKWTRLSGSNPPYHHDTLLWRFVERERDVYVSDEKTEIAMEESTRNGCKVIVIMGYGNWLYLNEAENEAWEIEKFPRPFPAGPITPESREGYKNWVRYMVRHYKGKVACWEIYNEPEFFGWNYSHEIPGMKEMDYGEQVKDFCRLVKEVVPVIREEDPEIKIGLGGAVQTPGIGERDWLLRCMEEGVFELVDQIGWHIQGAIVPEKPAFRDYPGLVRDFKKKAEAHGFKGEYLASEMWLGASYPPHEFWVHPPHNAAPGFPRLSELRKAKDTARIFLMNAALDVTVFWCNTWFNGAAQDGGLFRTTFTADPVTPTQPNPTYYAVRTLATLLDGAKPAEVELSTSVEMDNLHTHGFSLPDGSLMVGLYKTDVSVDDDPGVKTDVIISGVKCERVCGVDTLNGAVQELSYRQGAEGVEIPGLIIRDYPLILKLSLESADNQ